MHIQIRAISFSILKDSLTCCSFRSASARSARSAQCGDDSDSSFVCSALCYTTESFFALRTSRQCETLLNAHEIRNRRKWNVSTFRVAMWSDVRRPGTRRRAQRKANRRKLNAKCGSSAYHSAVSIIFRALPPLHRPVNRIVQ